MELRQLRDFVALAEELHYARAAARLGIDQSPLSRRIKEFEEHLGVLLFARTSRGTQLTPRGEFLLPWARSILAAADRAEALVRSPSPSQDIVRVALCDDVPSKDLFPALAKFQQSRPHAAISQNATTCERQAEELASGLTDVSFGLFVHPAGRSDLIVERLWGQSACVLLPQDHALVCERKLEAKELGDSPIGLLSPSVNGLLQQSQLESIAHHVSTNPNLITAENLTLLMSLVLSGTCVGLVGPAHAEMIQPVDFVVKPLAYPPAQFATRMAYRVGETRAAVKALIEFVRIAWQRTDARIPPSGA
jgi:DNA-binding transcriptional LysR family regulator